MSGEWGLEDFVKAVEDALQSPLVMIWGRRKFLRPQIIASGLSHRARDGLFITEPADLGLEFEYILFEFAVCVFRKLAKIRIGRHLRCDLKNA